MQYMGGKQKIAQELSNILLTYKGSCHTYIEPFLGGGSVAQYMVPHFQQSYAGDNHADLVLMWQELLLGSFIPPTALTEEEYQKLKNQTESSALRGLIGFGCSFGGKWFGGYARNKREDDFLGAAIRGLAKKQKGMSGLVVKQMDFTEWKPYSGCFVYCDPPYANTTGYSTQFDYELFWDTVVNWVCAGVEVFVSEYSIPTNIPRTLITQWKKNKPLNHNTEHSIENLYRIVVP